MLENIIFIIGAIIYLVIKCPARWLGQYSKTPLIPFWKKTQEKNLLTAKMYDPKSLENLTGSTVVSVFIM